MDRLMEYANNGGHIIAFGQDLASVTGSARNDGNEPFFYDFTLGADYLQDSVNAEEVFTDTAQLLTGLPGSPFSNTSFDISAMGDGAGNQVYIDEIAKIIGRYGCDGPDSPDLCRDQYRAAAEVRSGWPVCGPGLRGDVASRSAHAGAPRRHLPGQLSVYFSFGLEGVNNDTGFNTREDLLGWRSTWAWDTADSARSRRPRCRWAR